MSAYVECPQCHTYQRMIGGRCPKCDGRPVKISSGVKRGIDWDGFLDIVDPLDRVTCEELDRMLRDAGLMISNVPLTHMMHLMGFYKKFGVWRRRGPDAPLVGQVLDRLTDEWQTTATIASAFVPPPMRKSRKGYDKVRRSLDLLEMRGKAEHRDPFNKSEHVQWRRCQ